MKKFKKLSFIVIQIMFCLLTVSNNIYAAGSAGNSGMFKIYNPINNPFSNTVSAVIGVIQAVGMSIAVIILVWLGVKYIMASPDGKAEIKKQAFGYILGAVLLFGASWLVPLLKNVIDGLSS